MSPIIFAPWAEDLLTRATLRPDDCILDIACGTGVVTRR
jgi:ubiquinone/menaquinone biosynthesis C-methylase UbiE